jgi:hypothetical protein
MALGVRKRGPTKDLLPFSALLGLLRVSYIEPLSSAELEFSDGSPR